MRDEQWKWFSCIWTRIRIRRLIAETVHCFVQLRDLLFDYMILSNLIICFNHLIFISITWSSFQSLDFHFESLDFNRFISITWWLFQSLDLHFNHLFSFQSHDLHFNHLLFSISNDSWLFFVYFLVCSYVRFIWGPALHGCHIPPGIAGEYMIFFWLQYIPIRALSCKISLYRI